MPCQIIKKVYQNSGGIEIETLIDFYLFLEDLTTSFLSVLPALSYPFRVRPLYRKSYWWVKTVD